MENKRKWELFTETKLKEQSTVVAAPAKLFPQERDWTCAFACLRTLMSGFERDLISEDQIVTDYKPIPGPHYSRDIKKLGILDKYDVVYGCDQNQIDFDYVLDLCRDGYYLMLESMINYAHWMVFLGYYPFVSENLEESQILLYDPYYNKVRLNSTDEFINMWLDGNYENTKIERDFIAVRAKTE